MSRKPKQKEHPKLRRPVWHENPESFDKKNIRFRSNLMDFEHKWWGLERLSREEWIKLHVFMKSTENDSWAEIKLASGGRKHGTNHHSLEIADFNKEARKRIEELNLQKKIGDTLFSFRITGTVRLYGYREEEFFSTIWYDPFHGDHKKEAYPTKKN